MGGQTGGSEGVQTVQSDRGSGLDPVTAGSQNLFAMCLILQNQSMILRRDAMEIRAKAIEARLRARTLRR